MRVALLILLLCGCSSVGSNIEQETMSDLKGKEKLDATMEESRKSSAPQPLTINVSTSGNSRSQVDIKEPSPKLDDVKLGKSMKSDSMFDQSLTELYSQHSGLFYLFCAFAFALLVWAWKHFENTTIFKAARPLADLGSHLARRMMDTDRTDPMHKAYSDLLREVESRERDVRHRGNKQT